MIHLTVKKKLKLKINLRFRLDSNYIRNERKKKKECFQDNIDTQHSFDRKMNT